MKRMLRSWIRPWDTEAWRSGPFLLAVLAGALFVLDARSARAVASREPDASELLRRAEEVRSPDMQYAVDFTITVRDDYTPGVPRSATYTMVASGKDSTMVLMLRPEGFYGGTLLIESGEYWLILPKATRSLQLSSEQVLRGDIANGDLARGNLLAAYRPRLTGQETVGDDRCWRLELAPAGPEARYARIVLWAAVKDGGPRKLEYYGQTEALLRTVLYHDYRRTALGLRSMRLEVDSPLEMRRKTTLVFSNLRRVNPGPIVFTPDGMVPFRDAAMARRHEGGAPASIEEILTVLAAPRG
jgi:hypothetical protein